MGKFQILAREVAEKKTAPFRSVPCTKPIVFFAAVRSNLWFVNLGEECCVTS